MSTPNLFSPLSLGTFDMPNRIFMAPMTRGRAAPDGTATTPMIDYYSSRADAGLLISEGICVSPAARGWTGAPGLYTKAHVDAWRAVTAAVRARGGRIYAQLWYLGRVSHPYFLAGATPWAPSAIKPNAHVHTRAGERLPCITPHEMTIDDIRMVMAEYSEAAARAIDAGFDGVQIHGANGYLPDQFLRDKCNHRCDDYGGSARNRSRFMIELAAACAAAIGPERVSIRLSPRNRYNDIDDSDPGTTFGTVAEHLAPLGLAFLEVMEGLPGHFLHVAGAPLLPMMKQAFGGVVVANGGYDRESADAAISRGEADAISFGIPFLANPDLVVRFRQNAPLNAPDPATFYTAGEPGYLNYPLMGESPPGDPYRPLSLEDASRH